jgi:hypothetical protein
LASRTIRSPISTSPARSIRRKSRPRSKRAYLTTRKAAGFGGLFVGAQRLHRTIGALAAPPRLD